MIFETISIIQRSFEVHKAIVSNAKHIFVFKQGCINAKVNSLAEMPKYRYYKYKYNDVVFFMEPVT